MVWQQCKCALMSPILMKYFSKKLYAFQTGNNWTTILETNCTLLLACIRLQLLHEQYPERLRTIDLEHPVWQQNHAYSWTASMQFCPRLRLADDTLRNFGRLRVKCYLLWKKELQMISIVTEAYSKVGQVKQSNFSYIKVSDHSSIAKVIYRSQ